MSATQFDVTITDPPEPSFGVTVEGPVIVLGPALPTGPAGADGSGSGVTDGDKGDVVVTSSGTVWTVPDLSTLDTRLDALEAVDPLTQTEGDARYWQLSTDLATQVELNAEAALARNADNLTSGTVADARIAATIARDSEVTAAIAALSTVYQPLDSDLTAIAALTTTAYGRAFLALADAAAGRTALGLGTAATAATGDFDAAGAAAAAQAASQPLDSDLTAIAALTTTAFGRGLLALADAAALRSSAGLVLGTDIYSKAAVDSGFQPLDGDLTALAAAGNSAVLAATTASFLTADETKLDGIEALADVTDAANVAAAGAVMEADTTTAAMSFVVDEDDMASNSATKLPTQQSVKAYADAGDVALAGSIASGDSSTLGTAQTYADGKVSNTAYDAGTWDAVTGVAPSKNAVRDKLEALDAAKANLSGATFSGDISVPDEAYDATAWNGSLEVPTKNAVRDKIETMGGGSVSDTAYGSGWNGDTTVAPSKNAVYDEMELRAPLITSWFVPAENFLTLGGVPTQVGNSEAVAHWLLDAATTESVAATVHLPFGWSTVHIDIYWANHASTSGNVRWAVRPDGELVDGEAVDDTGTQTEATIAAPSTVDVLKISQIVTSMTFGTTRGVIVRRIGGDAGDTLANDVRFYGLRFRRAS